MAVLVVHIRNSGVTLLPDEPEFPYDCHALWLQTPHMPTKLRLAIDALAAGLPRLMA